MRRSHWELNVRSILLSMSLFHLNAVDAIDAVNEEDENKDEGDLESIS